MTGPGKELPGSYGDRSGQPRGAEHLPQSELRVVDVVHQENRRGIPLMGLDSVAAALRIFAVQRALDSGIGSQRSQGTIQTDLSRHVIQDEGASALGLNALTSDGVNHDGVDQVQREFIDDRLIEKALWQLGKRSNWEWVKPDPMGVTFNASIHLKPLGDHPDAYILEIGYGDNELEQSFARSLGVERGLESSTLDVVFAHERPDRFRVDFGEVAQRLQGVYESLHGFEDSVGVEPYALHSDGSRPPLTPLSIVNPLRSSTLAPHWVMLGLREGVDVSMNIKDIGYTEYSGSTGNVHHAWTVDGTVVDGSLGPDYDWKDGKEIMPPILRFNIGRYSSRLTMMRRPAVTPQMIGAIHDLTSQVQAAFPVAA